MNIDYEWLQEIIITTKNGYILRLHLGKQLSDFRLYGEYFDTTEKKWWRVEFSSEMAASASQLVENCLKNFSAAMVKKNDSIITLHNPCNAPFLNQNDQEAILKRQIIAARVSVN